MWFVLTKILIGPLSKYFAKGIVTADVGTGEIKNQ
jgi:hypothetical protein